MGIITSAQVRQQISLIVSSLLLFTTQASTTTHFDHISSQQQHSLDETFLKDAVMDCLKDDIPQVVAAALKVLEVSELMEVVALPCMMM